DVDAVSPPRRAVTLSGNAPAWLYVRLTVGEFDVVDEPSPKFHTNSVPDGNDPAAVNWKLVLNCTPAPSGTDMIVDTVSVGSAAGGPPAVVVVGAVGVEAVPPSPAHPATVAAMIRAGIKKRMQATSGEARRPHCEFSAIREFVGIRRKP